jgi:hypothetical protein
MLFNKYTEEEIRGISRQTLETLEYWLRQVIDESMKAKYGSDYLNAKDNGGGSILPIKIINKIIERKSVEIERYSRVIDASLLDDLITIICHPKLYDPLFKKYFKFNFPNGINELRLILNRLIDPRNRLSHANPISHRQAQQVICYSNDIIDSIKNYYLENNMYIEYNIPRIIRFKDSFGNEVFFDKTNKFANVNFTGKYNSYLRPYDTLEIEIEIDFTFGENEYDIKWMSPKIIPDFGNTKKISMLIEDHHVGSEFNIQCRITSTKSWHRMTDGCDDILYAWYKVLPSI